MKKTFIKQKGEVMYNKYINELDSTNLQKRSASIDILNSSRKIVVSTQVLNEFSAVLLKNLFSDEEIRIRVEEIAADSSVMLIKLDTIRLAWDMRKRYRFSFWDSLIVSSALRAGCKTIYTEDLQHAMIIDGTLHVINPFLCSI